MEQPNPSEAVHSELVELRSELRQMRDELAELREGYTMKLEGIRHRLQTQVTTSEAKLRRHTTATARDTVHQVEAMWQLFPKVPRFRAQMPPSGGFPMDVRTLLHLSAILDDVRPRSILELGGGTSTIWMGYLTEDLGTRIFSVDHLDDYLKSTSDYVERHGFVGRIECRLAPLEQVTVEENEYSWYSVDRLSDISNVDLLLVDGPPESTGPRARYPALPLLQEKLRPGAVVVLDDTHRAGEQAILEAWARLGAGYEQADKGLSRLGLLRPLTE